MSLFFNVSVVANTNFVTVKGTQILDPQGKPLFFNGINLGNWLLWEGYLMMGDFKYRTHSQFLAQLTHAFGSWERAKRFEREWRLNYVTETSIRRLKELGYNSVRVPFHYKLFWHDNKLTDEGFEYFDRLIRYCRKYQVYVLLDMHAAPGYQNPGDHSDNLKSNERQPRESVGFWDSPEHLLIAQKVWRHIARRYKNEPVIWGYDLMNEPVPQQGREYELLPSLLAISQAIREVDNNHIVVAEGAWWSSDLSKLDWHDEKVQRKAGIKQKWDDKLVYQLHHYGPAEETFGRERFADKLNVPIILGEFGESDNVNLSKIASWAKAHLAGYYIWSFKKISHDRTLWTIPTNEPYEKVKHFINHGGKPPIESFDGMLSFARENLIEGHGSHIWHQAFYDAIKPTSN